MFTLLRPTKRFIDTERVCIYIFYLHLMGRSTHIGQNTSMTVLISGFLHSWILTTGRYLDVKIAWCKPTNVLVILMTDGNLEGVVSIVISENSAGYLVPRQSMKTSLLVGRWVT